MSIAKPIFSEEKISIAINKLEEYLKLLDSYRSSLQGDRTWGIHVRDTERTSGVRQELQRKLPIVKNILHTSGLNFKYKKHDDVGEMLLHTNYINDLDHYLSIAISRANQSIGIYKEHMSISKWKRLISLIFC